MRSEIVRGDGMKMLAALPPGSVDLLLTDPPYGVTRLEWDSPVQWALFWELANRACKPTACQVLFLTQPAALPMIEANRKAFRYELVWHKNGSTGFLDARRRPMRSHENIFVFCREFGGSGGFKATYNPVMRDGKPYSKGRGKAKMYAHFGKVIPASDCRIDGKRYPSSVLFFDRPHHGEHPTQKPIKLMRWLVSTFSNAGDLVVDPFGGSGTTAVACAELGREFVVVERSAEYCKVAQRRVRDAIAALPLPPDALVEDRAPAPIVPVFRSMGDVTPKPEVN